MKSWAYGQLVKKLTEEIKNLAEKEYAVLKKEYYDPAVDRVVSDNLRLERGVNATTSEGRLVLRTLINVALKEYLGEQKHWKERLEQLKRWIEEGKIVSFPIQLGGDPCEVPDVVLTYYFSETDQLSLIDAIENLLKALEED